MFPVGQAFIFKLDSHLQTPLFGKYVHLLHLHINKSASSIPSPPPFPQGDTFNTVKEYDRHVHTVCMLATGRKKVSLSLNIHLTD